jgi:hypothetical protein
MECPRCGDRLSRPGDYCLVCRTQVADTVVIDIDRDRATLTMLRGDERLGVTQVTTTPESPPDDEAEIELRNFAGRIADEIHRKRPEAVYVAGDRAVVSRLRSAVTYELRRVGVGAEDPVSAVLDRRDDPSLEVVEATPAEKISGAHTTVIGERRGKRALSLVAAHPHVKKLVPGPIEAGGAAGGAIRADATRADVNGNLRLRVRDGSSVQENRIVTTAGDRKTGEVIREDLNDALGNADLHRDG